MQKLRNYLTMTCVFSLCLMLWLVMAPIDHVIHLFKKYRRKAALRTSLKLAAKGK